MMNLFYNPTGQLEQVAKSFPGSFAHILMIPTRFVSYLSTPNPATGTMGKFTVKPGVGGWGATLPPHERAFVEEDKETDAGPVVQTTIRFFLPFESVPNHYRIATMRNDRFLVFVRTSGGIMRIVGDLANGARFSRVYDSGSNFQAIPGIYGTFRWESPSIAPVWDESLGEVPTTGGGGGGTGTGGGSSSSGGSPF